MSNIVPRRAAFVCNACRSAQGAQRTTRPLSTFITISTSSQRRAKAQARSRLRGASYTPYRYSSTADASLTGFQERVARTTPMTATDPSHELAQIQSDTADIVQGNRIPSSKEIVALLERGKEFARFQVIGKHYSASKADADGTGRTASTSSPDSSHDTSSAILDDLDESSSQQNSEATLVQHTGFSLAFRSESASTLAETLYNLVRDPKINITSSMLRLYTHTQCLLGKPEYLPEIFEQYVNKPRASQASPSQPVSYKPRTLTWRADHAIPLDLAETALSAAIYKRDMGLAVAITDTTVGTAAYRTNRFIVHAVPKLAVVSIFPMAAFTLSNWASTLQNTFEPGQARMMALAAGMTYIGTFGTIAYVAVTTWSDHHDRVHWQVAAGLGERWLREDERMFLDKIAQAWGFEDKDRRGEEMGAEWEALRDTIGLRSMVLDKTEFMKGFS